MTFSQNKKIAISAVAIFMLSFSTLVFFLNGASEVGNSGHTNVLHSNETHDTPNPEEDFPYKEVETACEDETTDYENQSIFIISTEGKFMKATEEFCDLLGINCKEISEHSLFDFVYKEDFPRFTSDHAKLIRDGEAKEGMGPFRMETEKGQLMFLFNVCPVLDKNEKVNEIIFKVKDITDQVKDLDHKDSGDSGEEEQTWLEKIYPKIKDLNQDSDGRLMVDKLS